MSRNKDQAGTFELLAKLPGQFIALAKAEYENAKREVGAKLKRGGIGLLAIIVALFFIFFAIGSLVFSAIAGIGEALPLWLAALIVAGSLLVLAAAAILLGIALMKRGIPVPEDTIDRVEGDFQAMGEVRFNASAHVPQHGEKGNWR